MPPQNIVSNLYEHPEIFFPIFTGEPGRLEKYWVENQDLYKSLGRGSSETWQFEVCFLFGFFIYVYTYVYIYISIYQFRCLGLLSQTHLNLINLKIFLFLNSFVYCIF